MFPDIVQLHSTIKQLPIMHHQINWLHDTLHQRVSHMTLIISEVLKSLPGENDNLIT